MNAQTLAERSVIRIDGCHEWIGPIKGRGYGAWTRPIGYAHRAAYIFNIGPIPDGYMVHHLCGFKLCVNPDHLVAVSPQEHGALHRRQMCARGLHEMTPENTYEWRGKDNASLTRCRACSRERSRKYIGWQGGVWNRDKTHCKRGHPLSGENLYITTNGKRYCRTCRRDASRAHAQRKE